LIPRDCDDEIDPAGSPFDAVDVLIAVRNERKITEIVNLKLGAERDAIVIESKGGERLLISLVVLAEVHRRMAAHYDAEAAHMAATLDAEGDAKEREIDPQEEQGEP